MDVRLEKFTASLGHRYELERELGTGATATVFLANDTRYQRRVAVKVFRTEVAEALGHERFVREIAVVAQLSHPHIVPLLDSGEVEGMMFYVMPAIDGETLRERMTRITPFPIDEALQIARDVAVALDYAHGRDVVHRDIKPENILLTAGTAVVADFGIAKMLNARSGGHSLTRDGMAVGTVMYMSPEQASAGPIDGRSDLYALACVLFEMLAGRPPFVGPSTRAVVVSHFTDAVPSLHALRAEVALPLESAINRALAKDPEERYGTASEFVDALVKARRSASRERMWRQLGGTTPPPKSGEWHGGQALRAIAEGGHAAEPGTHAGEEAAGATGQRLTSVRVPVRAANGGGAIPASPAADREAGTNPLRDPARASTLNGIVIAAVAVAVGALAWVLLR